MFMTICVRKKGGQGGDNVTEEDTKRAETVVQRLRRSRRGEVTGVADWEIRLLLGYIDDMKRKAEKQK